MRGSTPWAGLQLRHLLALEAVAEQVEELRLGHLPALEVEQRVLAVHLGRAHHRVAERLDRQALAFHHPGEAAEERRRQHAAEVRDDRADQAAGSSSSSRSASS